MQRLNRDVVRFVGASRERFVCVHPYRRTLWSFVSFVCRALIASVGYRQAQGRVHVGDAAALPLGYLCARLGRMKLSVTACGLDVIHRNWFYQQMIRFCLHRCDQVICISEATAEEVRMRGVPENRMTIIPCGIDPSLPFVETVRDPHLLLTVGRLVKRKGVAWFLEHVFPVLLRDFPDLRYVIVGDGSVRRHIQSIIRKHHLHDSVMLCTNVSDEDRTELLHGSTVFVAPNIHVKGDMEGFGIVCLEAAAAGLPVAAANIEGLKDAVVEGKTGMFFASENAEDCVRIITQMVNHPLDPQGVHDAVMRQFAWTRLTPLYNNVLDA